MADIKKGGREKHVTSGTGSVKKRGSGQNSQKPVGEKTGYASRKPSRPQSSSGQTFSSSGSSGSGSSGGGFSNLFGGASSSSSGSAKKGGLNFKRILVIIAVVVVAIIIIRACAGSSGLGGLMSGVVENSGLIPGGDSVVSSGGGSLSNNAVLNTAVSPDARAKRINIIGGGRDEFTIMIYMCGTDLESRLGMATKDLNEILHADISESVNIVIETGGTRTWKNNVISSDTNQRYQATSEGLVLLEDNLGRRDMTDPNTLTDFIRYGKREFPANRYALILWDHGGGSAQGYGHDEYNFNATMTLDKIDDALNSAGTTFDFVGFDACLMATYETALMLDRYADYLIASEETEPGIGWYYTDWITALSENTSMPTTEIGKNIIDDFVEHCYQNSQYDKATLSIIDLAEFSGTVPDKFSAFARSTAGLIQNNQYEAVSDARSDTREFGSPNPIDQIDLIHLAQNIDTPEADELADVLAESVKYNRISPTISNANGVSIYFPFDKLSTVGSVLTTYDEIGMDAAYSDCIKAFANVEAGGQVVSSGSSSPMGSLLGSLGSGSTGGSGIGMEAIGSLLGSFLSGGNFGSILGQQNQNDTNWIEPDAMEESVPYYEDNYLDSDNLTLTEKNGGYVLHLSDEEWDVIQTLNLNVFVDDGEGYIDLGLDNVYEFDDDEDLIVDYDGTWLSINGNVIAYYFMSEDVDGNSYTITGRVPAFLNDERVDIIIVFTDENPYGSVVGARKVYEDESNAVPKGLIPIEYGDTIDFLCDYYTYDQEYDDSYYLGEAMVVEGDLEISNISIGNIPALVTYRLTDIYNNTYWTPALQY